MGRSSVRAVLLASGPVLIGVTFSVATFHSNVLAWVCFTLGALAILSGGLPFISRLRVILKPSRAGERLVRIQTVYRRDLYTGGVKYLQAEPHRELLIYAPTGAWHPEPEKKKWIRAVADALINGLSEKERSRIEDAQKREVDKDMPPLECFKAVFGLPPLPSHPTDEQRSEFGSLLAEMEELLAPLDDVASAQVRYLGTEGYTHPDLGTPPGSVARAEIAAITPGMGVIIFDQPLSLFALAVDARPQMGYALTVDDQEVNTQFRQWFYNNLYPALENNVLQDAQRHVTLRQGFAKLRAEHGIMA